jgi:hypothetical protein
LDYIKLALVALIFFVAAPLAGVAMKGRPTWQFGAFGVMCFMTINGLMSAGNWGLTLDSIETYRGHTKGYHFYFNHAIAIALIVAKWGEDRHRFRWLPPGMGLYLAYSACSLISVVNAPDKSLVFMAAHKMLFASLLMIATFNLLRTPKDMQFFLKVMVGVLAWQLLVCLKLKYMDGMYQVRGTFEHQNPLAMYAVLIAMPLLAVALGPPFKGSNIGFFGFFACAGIVQSTLSRAALAVFGAGTIALIGLSLLERPTARRLLATAVIGVVGTAGLLLALDTIISRFHDHGNDASAELREVMKNACRQMVKDHPLGIGWNNYALVVNPPFQYADVYYEWIRSRNMQVDESKPNSVVESHYYLLLAETGYPGLMAWLALIGYGLWLNVRAFFSFEHSFLRCLSLGLAMGCTLNYAQSTLERVLTQPRNMMLWLILLAITSRIEIIRREDKKRRLLKASAVL